MLLGMINSWTEDGFRQVNSYGLKAIEFCYNIGNDPADLETALPDLKKWSRGYDVQVGSMGRWGTDKLDEKGAVLEDEFRNNCKLIDIASELGCPVFNTGVNYLENLSYLQNCNAALVFLSRLCDYGQSRGVKIATYNCHWNNYIDRPKAWELVHKTLPALGIKYDPSHCIITGDGRYIDEIIDWGDRFHHFHIKGTLTANDEVVDCPPAGMDDVRWPAVFAALYAKHYDGMLSIEPHSATWQGPLGDFGVRFTIDYIRKFIFNGGE